MATADESGRHQPLFDPHLVVRRLPGVQEVHGVFGSGNTGYSFCCAVDVESSADAKSRRTSVVRLVENSAANHSQEVQGFMKLSHPNLVQLYKIVLGPPDAYYFEFCAGGSIDKVVHSLDGGDQWTKLRLWQRARVALDIAMAVEFLHDHGIAHRDVTVKNCFLEERFDAAESVGVDRPLPKAKLGYLGVSCTNAVYLTTRGLGTVRSMAPEVISSNNYGAAADVYAFSIVLYELVCRVVPYSCLHCTAAALALAICRGLRPDLDASVLADGSRGAQMMKALIRDLWAEDPATRPDATRAVARLTDLAQPGAAEPAPVASAAASASSGAAPAAASPPPRAGPSPRGAEREDLGCSSVCIQGQWRNFAEPQEALTTPRASGGLGGHGARGPASWEEEALTTPRASGGLGCQGARGPASWEEAAGHQRRPDEAPADARRLSSAWRLPASSLLGGAAAADEQATTVCIQAGRQMLDEPEEEEAEQDNWVKIL